MRIDEIDFAREFARRAHGSQMYGKTLPYMFHLEAVADIVTESVGNLALVDPLTTNARTLLLTLAYLHDVIEDTAIEATHLSALFSSRIGDCVAIMSDPKHMKRRDRKRIVNGWLSQIRLSSKMTSALVPALIVKAADRLANVRFAFRDANKGMLMMYNNEHAAFREAAYRPGLCDRVWEELDAYASGKIVEEGT